MALHYPHRSPSSEVRNPKQKWVVPGHILDRNTHSSQRELGPSEFKTFLFLFPRSHFLHWLFIPSFPLQNCLSPPSQPPTISSLALLPIPTGLMYSACFLPVLLALAPSPWQFFSLAPPMTSLHCLLPEMIHLTATSRYFNFYTSWSSLRKAFFRSNICFSYAYITPA